jgi:hypothetical protein
LTLPRDDSLPFVLRNNSCSFEPTLNYLIEQVGLSFFDAAFHNDRIGAPVYPPAVMLKIIFSCYFRGLITSGPLEYA